MITKAFFSETRADIGASRDYKCIAHQQVDMCTLNMLNEDKKLEHFTTQRRGVRGSKYSRNIN